MMRALVLGWPQHEAIWEFPDEYQLGDDLLVAPVCHEGATSVSVFIPDGEWVDAWSATTVVGPTVVERDVPWDEAAVYVRAARAGELLPLFTGLP
jgi:alpha-glucosidase (family GH31 glycosyl hydrolase)